MISVPRTNTSPSTLMGGTMSRGHFAVSIVALVAVVGLAGLMYTTAARGADEKQDTKSLEGKPAP
jgi:hypothetical protein